MEISCKSSSARSESLLFCIIQVLAFLKITDGCSTRREFVNASWDLFIVKWGGYLPLLVLLASTPSVDSLSSEEEEEENLSTSSSVVEVSSSPPVREFEVHFEINNHRPLFYAQNLHVTVRYFGKICDGLFEILLHLEVEIAYVIIFNFQFRVNGILR